MNVAHWMKSIPATSAVILCCLVFLTACAPTTPQEPAETRSIHGAQKAFYPDRTEISRAEPNLPR